MTDRLTDWFPGYIKPIRKGLYHRKYGLDDFLTDQPDYWDGWRWRYAKGDAVCLFQDRQWRGLAVNPATKEKEDGRE